MTSATPSAQQTPTPPRTTTPHARDRALRRLNAATGVATAATLALVGATTGLAARATQQQQAAKRAARSATTVMPRTVPAARVSTSTPRPTRTVVTESVTRSTSAGWASRVGGGTISRYRVSRSAPRPSAQLGSRRLAPRATPATRPVAPRRVVVPPNPPAAPSTGS